jgi:hypothetical protein
MGDGSYRINGIQFDDQTSDGVRVKQDLTTEHTTPNLIIYIANSSSPDV